MTVTINGDTGISGVNGSAATPAIQGGDADTGIFFGTNTASISTGGTSRLVVDSSGRLLVNTSTQSGTANQACIYSAGKNTLSIIDTTSYNTGVGGAINLGGNYRTNGDAQAFVRISAVKENATNSNYSYGMQFNTTANGEANFGVSAMRIDSSGRLLVGREASGNVGAGSASKLQVDSSSGFSIGCFGRSSGTGAGGIAIGKSRDGAIVQDNDDLGSIVFAGHDGNDLQTRGAFIKAEVEGDPDTNDMPAALTIGTNPGQASPVERMRFTSSREVVINRSSSSNFNIDLNCEFAAKLGGQFVGRAHDTINSNARTVLLHRMDVTAQQGFQFSGDFIVNSFTGNAFVTLHITKVYTTNSIEVDVVHATRSAQIAQTNLRVITATYGSENYLAIQKNGGGTGTSNINAYITTNINQHGGIREVNNTSLANVVEIAKLNY